MTLKDIEQHFHQHFPNVSFEKYATAVKLYKFSQRLSLYKDKKQLTPELCYLLVYPLHDLKLYFDATLTGKNNIDLKMLNAELVQELEFFLLKIIQTINSIFFSSLQPSIIDESFLMNILDIHERAIQLSLQLSKEHISALNIEQ